MSTDDKLSELRARIDALDEQIQALINERAACAQAVAGVKLEADEDTHFYRPEREVAILRRVSERNTGPLPDEEMARLFREIMSACLALEKPLTIAYLGPEGTFTQSAALKQFGHSVETVALDGIDDVFREVEAGAADYGVVPVENSTEGVVRHTLDLFQNSPLHVCGEVQLRIHHHLLVRDDDLPVTQVLAHQQALAQCRAWLEANLPDAVHVAVASNAEAARLASETEGAAAIASETAAELYGLVIRDRNIEDEPDNTTRFLVIGRQAALPSGNDLTSLLISVRNKPGILYQMLQHIARHGVSMTRIESRPSRQGIWEYLFYIDVEGHQEDPTVAAALADLENEALVVKVLGSYPRAVI
ncbi:MAG: prephenate dehydratase [Gammaproteobacteria bacterium]|nr:prephenate dehydratase [Gammaproteobacteria bacterium]NNJ93380.1 prephenate dehydratase [Halobacteria archaeon]